MALIQSVGFDFENCWDSPLSFWMTYELVAVIVASVAIGIYLRGLGRPRLRTVGSFLLAFAALDIFTFNHAGRNWGVDLFGNNGKYSTPILVSVLSLLLAILGTGSVIYFEKRAQNKSGNHKAG
jgi:hypothetical protein